MAAYKGGRFDSNMVFDRRTNPFAEEEDDDFERVSKDEAVTQIRAAQEKSLDSTKRSLALIEDSHDIAVKTGEELVYQREALNRTERNLDQIQNDMNIADRHIKSMKSIWGAMANYFKKPPKQNPVGPPPGSDKTPSTRRAEELLNESSLDFKIQGRRSDDYGYGDSGYSGASSFQGNAFAASDPYESQLNANLDAIAKGVRRLKEDALVLGDEIESSTVQIERIDKKAEAAGLRVESARQKVQKIIRK